MTGGTPISGNHQIDEYMDIMSCRWMDACMDAWMDGCMDGWMDGWMDKQMNNIFQTNT